jgi:CheY-like chemotaxis protein
MLQGGQGFFAVADDRAVESRRAKNQSQHLARRRFVVNNQHIAGNARTQSKRAGPMRILVAENDVPLADFLCQKLEAEQFSVDLIPGTREAENLIAERRSDLALLDLALPYAAGIDALRHIRAKKPELPVVYLTSLGSVDERARCLDAGADDLVAKPLAFAELAARIRAVLRRGSQATRAVASRGSGDGPLKPQRASLWPRDRPESQGILAIGIPDAPFRASGQPRNRSLSRFGG